MRQILRQSRFALNFSAAVVAIALSGCLDVAAPPKGLTVLATVGGNNQTIPIGASSVPALVVRAYDESGIPMSGVVVNWTIAQGLGALTVKTSTTDTNGDASNTFTPGSAAGVVTIFATAGTLTVTFSELVVPAG